MLINYDILPLLIDRLSIDFPATINLDCINKKFIFNSSKNPFSDFYHISLLFFFSFSRCTISLSSLYILSAVVPSFYTLWAFALTPLPLQNASFAFSLLAQLYFLWIFSFRFHPLTLFFPLSLASSFSDFSLLKVSLPSPFPSEAARGMWAFFTNLIAPTESITASERAVCVCLCMCYGFVVYLCIVVLIAC